MLNVSVLTGYFIRHHSIIFWNNERMVTFIILFNITWVGVTLYFDAHEIYRIYSLERIFRSVIKAIILHALIFITLIYLNNTFYFSRQYLLSIYITFTALIIVSRLVVLLLLKVLRQMGINHKNVIIINANEAGLTLMGQLKNDIKYGYTFLGFFDDNPGLFVDPDLIKGKVDDVPQFAQRNKVDMIIYSLTENSTERIRKLIDFAENNFIQFRIILDYRRFFNRKVNINFYGLTPLLTFTDEPLENQFNRFIKRTFDIVFSLFVMLFIFSWLFPIIAIAIKLDSKGPVFFLQQRNGFKNKVFTCWKFRSMKVNKEADSKQATKDDKRFTRLGRFLRKTNLDELPQFFNVLIGDMSVVGPRPHPLFLNREYARIIDRFMIRHMIKPGITGLSQVRGYRGITEKPERMEQRVVTDVWYIENWSFFLDLKIILQTVWVSIKGQPNAY